MEKHLVLPDQGEFQELRCLLHTCVHTTQQNPRLPPNQEFVLPEKRPRERGSEGDLSIAKKGSGQEERDAAREGRGRGSHIGRGSRGRASRAEPAARRGGQYCVPGLTRPLRGVCGQPLPGPGPLSTMPRSGWVGHTEKLASLHTYTCTLACTLPGPGQGSGGAEGPGVEREEQTSHSDAQRVGFLLASPNLQPHHASPGPSGDASSTH